MPSSSDFPPSTSSSRATSYSFSPSPLSPKLIGFGGHGLVHLIRQTTTPHLLVCKTVHHPPLSPRGTPLEARILEDLALPLSPAHICRLITCTHRPPLTRIYLEYCDAGDLASVLRQHATRARPVPEAFVWHVFLSAAHALALLHWGDGQAFEPHWAAIVHRDLKPANLLLQWPAGAPRDACYPRVKLADFGLAAVASGPGFSPFFAGGSWAYQPPELPARAGTAEADCWALGAVVHEMVHGRPPVADLPWEWEDTEANHWRWLRRPEAREVWPVGEPYTLELEVGLSLVLEWDPERRFTSRELV
ncbi:hypothetical protein MMC13_006970 [Lambiella insularis]|nr:hypothetical protein [Lambiella insularis]